MGCASYLEDIRDRQAEGLERISTGGCAPCIGIPTQPRELNNIQPKNTSKPSGNKTLEIPKNQSEQAPEYQSTQYEPPKEWEYTYRQRNKNFPTIDKAPQEQHEPKKQGEIGDVDFVLDWESYSSEDTIDLLKPNK